jgi:malate synthase
MAAFIPNRRDPQVTEARWRGCATTSCARRATASTARGWRTRTSCPSRWQVFADALGDRPNQKDRLRDEVRVTAEQIADLTVPGGTVTDAACA